MHATRATARWATEAVKPEEIASSCSSACRPLQTAAQQQHPRCVQTGQMAGPRQRAF
jgi:hypothetical protein